VLQFPRDWIGPRDELVPFGVAAGSYASGAVQSDPKLGPEPALPLGADDFWGEGSAAVQDALQAPRPFQPVGELSHDVPTETRRRWNRRPVRAATLIGLGAAAVVCAAVILASVASQSVVDLTRTPTLERSPSLASGFGLISSHAVAAARARRQTILHPARPRPTRGIRTRRHSAQPETGKVRVSKAVSQRSSASAHSVGDATRQPSTVRAAPVQVSPTVDSSSGDGSSPSPSSSSDASASSERSGSASPPPAGPVGPGAAFGPGHLG